MLQKLSFLLTVLVTASFAPEIAIAHGSKHKTCFCRVDYVNSNFQFTNITSYATGLEWHKLIVTPADKGDCRNLCGSIFDQNESAVANLACASYPDGSDIRATSQVAATTAQQARRRKLNIVFGRYCPVGWMSNTTNAPAGHTHDGLCKREFKITPPLPNPPPNGTPIGTWGFFWGDSLVEYGTAQNGGLPGPANPNAPKLCKLDTW